MKKNTQRKKIWIIGTGGIGSRHLQALKAVSTPLEIKAIDQSEEALRIAKERYDAMPRGSSEHVVEYHRDIPKDKIIDIVIVATTSGPRADIIKTLLGGTIVKYLILEKLLFQKKEDYSKIEELLEKKNVKTWVNCSMRMMPFWKTIRDDFHGQKITYLLHANRSGLATDLIHHLDYIAFVSGSQKFTLKTDLLDRRAKESKRVGYLEVTGTLIAEFADGSNGLFRCDLRDSSPEIIEILSHNKLCIIKLRENKAFVSKSPEWQWREIDAPILYQSQMTGSLVERLLAKGNCDLPPYEESARYHLQALEPLRKFLNTISSKKYAYYPFT